MTRYQYLLIKHTGKAVAQIGQVMLIGVVALRILPQLSRVDQPSTNTLMFAVLIAASFYVAGRWVQTMGELRAQTNHHETLAAHHNPHEPNG